MHDLLLLDLHGLAVIGSSFRQEYPVSHEDGTILLAHQ
jgi:hypothetical protein